MLNRYGVLLGLLGSFLLLPACVSAQHYDQGYSGNNQRYSGTVTCESQDYRRNYCRVPWQNAELVRQISKTACIRDRTWGMQRSGSNAIWVDGGCAGVFQQARRQGYRGDNAWAPGPNWDRTIRFRCESQDYAYHMCRVDTGQGGAVRIVRQISNTRCVEGRNWGWNRAGVWVSEGCAAEFEVDRRWR